MTSYTLNRTWINAREVTLNYAASLSLLMLGYWLYTRHPYFKEAYTVQHDLHWITLTGQEVLYYFLMAWAAVLPFYYYTLPDEHETKSRLVWRMVLNLRSRAPAMQEKVALLGTLVKLFFIPLALLWGLEHVSVVIENTKQLYNGGQFFPNGYSLLFNAIILVDIFMFTLGYTIEHPRLGNEIRSVEPTVVGWVVAFICYPPFNGVTGQMLGWYSSEYPEIDTEWLRYVSGGLILTLMSIYAWASVALFLKASNLTNRGIVSHGPYAWVRHPAYAAKNLAWWVGSVPILGMAWHESVSAFLLGVISVLGWTALYYLRAITEERHLGRDSAYCIYCEKVRWRFIPGLC